MIKKTAANALLDGDWGLDALMGVSIFNSVTFKTRGASICVVSYKKI